MGQDRKNRNLVRGVAAGGEMVFWFLLGFFLGRWLDGVFHTTPWLTVSGILLGCAGGFWAMYRMLVGQSKD
ncbi:MAG: AtpZ/AtpI family protein [Clostridia bacterium]|jgi:ATP synthase protein I